MEERRCTDCKYFNNYYTHSNGRFHKLASGYCTNYNSGDKGRYIIYVKKNEGCECWEPIELRKIREKQSIVNILQEIHQRLNEIQQYLEEDKNL